MANPKYGLIRARQDLLFKLSCPSHECALPARVRRKPRRWDPLVPIWGGCPVPGGSGPAAGAP
jgi:hypothetical protein